MSLNDGYIMKYIALCAQPHFIKQGAGRQKLVDVHPARHASNRSVAGLGLGHS